MPRTGISSGTLCSAVENGLPFLHNHFAALCPGLRLEHVPQVAGVVRLQLVLHTYTHTRTRAHTHTHTHTHTDLAQWR